MVVADIFFFFFITYLNFRQQQFYMKNKKTLSFGFSVIMH